MRDESTTSKTLLAKLGFTTSDQLWALSKPTDESPTATTAAYLASSAAMALISIDDAERHADQALTSITDSAANDARNATQGYRRNAQWVLQAARQYEDHVATITAQVAAYLTAAHALAALLELKPLDAEGTELAAQATR